MTPGADTGAGMPPDEPGRERPGDAPTGDAPTGDAPTADGATPGSGPENTAGRAGSPAAGPDDASSDGEAPHGAAPDDAAPHDAAPHDAGGDAAPPAPTDGGGPDGGAPGRPELDIDAEFAAIVAAWDEPAPSRGAVHRWSVTEDLSGDGRGEERRDPSVPPVSAPTSERDPDPPTVWRQGPDPLEDPVPLSPEDLRPDPAAAEPERFVPPDPPPLPRGDLLLRCAWAAVLGGPLFLFGCFVLMPKPLPTWMLAVGVGGFVAGFVALVARMPTERGDDDDGAVV